MAVRHVIGEGEVTRTDPRSEARWREYEGIIASLVADGVDRLLDWGCGYGYVAAQMREAGLSPVCYEFVPDVDAELRFHPGIEVIVSDDPVGLPFRDGEFETALSLATLQHVQDKAGSLRELHRVLRPGGRLYVFKLPNRLSWVEAAARLLGQPHMADGRYPFDELYTRRAAISLLMQNGFEVQWFRRTNMLPLTKLQRTLHLPGGWLWRANRALERIPLANVFCTDFALLGKAV